VRPERRLDAVLHARAQAREGHGEGRIWAGLSGHGDEGQVKEAWGMSAQLVWYPGRRAACVTSDCYRPLFGVADNANFMIRGSEAGQ
jgi:hypothetical protein